MLTSRQIWKWTSNILWVIIFGLLLAMITVVISSRASNGEPEIFGYQFRTVLSGSMEPTFETGSLIVVKMVKDYDSLLAGDVITYKEGPDKIVTHRIEKVLNKGDDILYITKGDNNPSADMNPVLANNVIAVYTGVTIPFLGYFVRFASSNIGTAVLLITPGLVLLVYSIFVIRSVINEVELKSKTT